MGNMALRSAEEPDDLRATTGTVEVPMIRDNDAAVALGASPIEQHEPAARHNISIIVTRYSTAKPATAKSQSCQQPVVVVATRGRALSVIVIAEMSFCNVSHSDYVTTIAHRRCTYSMRGPLQNLMRSSISVLT